MDRTDRIYAAIDLKSFYASVECMSMGRDPMTTNLVVADPSRTEKTICLAVSPSLKSYGMPGRMRLFEVISAVERINAGRRMKAPGRKFTCKSDDINVLRANPEAELDYIVAPPRMKKYMEVSREIYSVYLQYVAPEDIFPYSIDEVFIDLTGYLKTYRKTARQMVSMMVKAVLNRTGITATAGIGTNLYLAKIAMDIEAKHAEADADGVRIAELDEMSYRKKLWGHRPITDFWRVGPGYAKKLADNGMFTMGDIALCSEDRAYGEPLLRKLFGVNAELLIDHAWGWEPVTLADVKGYVPEDHSLGQGQVLMRPYESGEARMIVREMTEALTLDLVEKGLACNAIVLTVNYDIENLTDPERKERYRGEIETDYYGRKAPKHAHGTENLGSYSSSTRIITEAMMRLYDRIIDPELLIRRITISADHVISEEAAARERKITGDAPEYEQLSLFEDYSKVEKEREKVKAELEKEKSLQKAVIGLKNKFGKNAILKGTDLQEGAMARSRNEQVGGHKA